MADYISREPMIREMQQLYEGVPYNFPNSTHTEWEILRGKYAAFIDYLKQQPAADVQPLSVVAEHIKNRLYETAFNTTEEKARDAIADMAERIDFWVSELKEGEQNGRHT